MARYFFTMRPFLTAIAGVLLLNVLAISNLQAQTTYYSRNGATTPRNWDEADSWTLNADGSGAAAAVPSRTDNVVVLLGHTIIIDNNADNGAAGVSPDGLSYANVGPFNDSGTATFYHKGDLDVNYGGTLSMSVKGMFEGKTTFKGTFTTTHDIINLGRMEIASSSTFSTGDDFILTGNSETLLYNSSFSTDDLYIDHTDAILCGNGTYDMVDALQFFNSATLSQVCEDITLTGCATCPQNGTATNLVGHNKIFINNGSVWRYLDDGSDQGSAWVSASFDDTGWSSGNAQFGYGDGDETTTVSFGADANNKHVTTYFRKSFYVDDPANYQSLLLKVMRDDGVVVYINGTEVERQNMPSGTITYTTMASQDFDFEEDAYYQKAISTSLLNSGTNYIAVEIHQAEVTSSDISFDLELVGFFGNDLISISDTWSYLDDGSNQGTAWIAPSFNDASWSTGTGELGYGDGDEATTTSYGADANNKHITTYFRHTFNVVDVNDFMSLDLNMKIDDGAVIYLNGAEIYRVNMPSGTISFNTMASRVISDTEEVDGYSVSISLDELVNGTNVMAIEVHQGNVTSSDISMSMQMLGVQPNILPVELGDFTAEINSLGKVDLEWNTFSEVNNDYFEIEHSNNGKQFTKIGSQSGNGTSTEEQYYLFTHSSPSQGLNYYRLKQVDLDGSYDYSDVVSVNMIAPIFQADWNVYPNPASDRLVINLETNVSLTPDNFKLRDFSGKQMTIDVIADANTLVADVSQLNSGMYYLELHTDANKVVKKVQILR